MITRRPVAYRVHLHLIAVLACLAVVSVRAADGRPSAAALITDLQGKATLSAAGDVRDITILTEIPPDSEVTLAPASRLVGVWIGSGEEFSFGGPASIRVTAAGPQMISGAAPTRRASPIERGQNIRIRTSGVAQSAVVMRSITKSARIRLLTLAGTRTLDPQPEFRWQPVAGMRQYRFELADASGRALVETDVSGDSYRLPAGITLDEGTPYTWEVSTRLPDGRKYASSADFVVMPAAQRERVEAIRPRSDASLAERVAFAAWLEQEDLRDEARKYWREAAAQRPEDAKLKQLAGQ